MPEGLYSVEGISQAVAGLQRAPERVEDEPCRQRGRTQTPTDNPGSASSGPSRIRWSRLGGDHRSRAARAVVSYHASSWPSWRPEPRSSSASSSTSTRTMTGAFVEVAEPERLGFTWGDDELRPSSSCPRDERRSLPAGLHGGPRWRRQGGARHRRLGGMPRRARRSSPAASAPTARCPPTPGSEYYEEYQRPGSASRGSGSGGRAIARQISTPRRGPRA